MTSIGLDIRPEREEQHHRQVTDPAIRAGGHTDISRQRQHEEQAAEHIFAFRHPGHRLGPQRMNGKQGGHQGAAPEPPVICRKARNSRIAAAACSATFVRWCPPGSEPYHWQSSMCEEGERMPIPRVPVIECPDDPGGSGRARHGILIDVDVVVVVDEPNPPAWQKTRSTAIASMIETAATTAGLPSRRGGPAAISSSSRAYSAGASLAQSFPSGVGSSGSAVESFTALIVIVPMPIPWRGVLMQ